MFSAPSRRSSISHVGHTRQTAEMEKRLGEYSEISVRDVTRKISVRKNIGSTICYTKTVEIRRISLPYTYNTNK
jgi:hypothetical protein